MVTEAISKASRGNFKGALKVTYLMLPVWAWLALYAYKMNYQGIKTKYPQLLGIPVLGGVLK